jgi:D-serine dehydratase
MRGEVADMLNSARAVLDSTKPAIQKAPVGKGSKAEIELMKSELAAAEATLKDAEADFAAEKFAPAKAKVMAATEKARGISQEIAAAVSKMKK